VITGGTYPVRELVQSYLDRADYVVAADTGVETALSYGVRPDLVVGDFDSLSDESLLEEFDAESVRRFGRAKDETDTEIALRLVDEAGADHVVLVGGGGGRVDHLLGIASIFERDRHPDLWITDVSAVRALDDEAVEHGTIGETISFLPLGCEPCRMTSSGLRWPLDALTWGRGNAGLSNEFAEPVVRVRMRSGRLLVVRSAGSV